jgi:hypothetical protein
VAFAGATVTFAFLRISTACTVQGIFEPAVGDIYFNRHHNKKNACYSTSDLHSIRTRQPELIIAAASLWSISFCDAQGNATSCCSLHGFASSIYLACGYDVKYSLLYWMENDISKTKHIQTKVKGKTCTHLRLLC